MPSLPCNCATAANHPLARSAAQMQIHPLRIQSEVRVICRNWIKKAAKTSSKPRRSWLWRLTNNGTTGHSGATLIRFTGNVMQQALALRLLLPAAKLHGDVVAAG